MARRLEEPHTLLYVLHFAGTVAMLVPDPERFVHVRETIELASALDQRLVLLLALPCYVTALLARGEGALALAELPRYDQLLEEFPQPRHRFRRLLLDSLLAALRGDLEQMECRSRDAQQLVQRNGSGAARILWLLHRFALAQLLARPELIEEGEATLAILEPLPRDRPFLACLLAMLGRRAQAAEVLCAAQLAALAPDSSHLLAAAEACVLLQDASLADQLYPQLAGASDGLRWTFPGGTIGLTGRVLGDLARLLGRDADALRHYDQALALCEAIGAPLLAQVCQRSRDAVSVRALSPALPPGSVDSPSALGATLHGDVAAALSTLRREGDVWSLRSSSGLALRFKHSKGLEYLRSLLDSPGRALHVVVFVGFDAGAGDAGVVLDERAKGEYRRRLEELREVQAEAERFADSERARRAEDEIAALAAQLAAAVGLGGRDRRAASDVERIRINVQRRLKDTIARIERADGMLGRYLARTVKTGTYCSYLPL
jgi:tetratricopeptide (TPR) repeat protein